MKRSLYILYILAFIAVSCTDVYDGEKRYVIEGTLLNGTEVVKNEKVELFSVKIDNNRISREEEERYTLPVGGLSYERGYNGLSAVTSDRNGNFRFGFPAGDDWVFYIRVKNKSYGYFSYRNMPDYYYHIGELNLKEDKPAEP
jgi:hypothetical protein